MSNSSEDDSVDVKPVPKKAYPKKGKQKVAISDSDQDDEEDVYRAKQKISKQDSSNDEDEETKPKKKAAKKKATRPLQGKHI